MRTFDELCASLGVGNATPAAPVHGSIPAMVTNFNAGGGGFQRSIVVGSPQLPSHITIYATSWDGMGQVPFYGAAPLGPHGLHLTYTPQGQPLKHVFYKYESGSLWCLTDGESAAERTTVETFLRAIGPHLS